MSSSDCVAFLQWTLPRLNMRWPGFRKVRGQVCKRIRRRIAVLGLEDYEDYRDFVEENPAEWDVLDSFCRVTISRFYRDRGVFDLLAQRLLPLLAEQTTDLRCWSAGCASGEEPYTLAILLRMRARADDDGTTIHITATDADPVLLERASRACYPEGTLRELPVDWNAVAFTAQEDEFCLREEFRGDVRFRCQDIREEMPSGPFHLILCRNLAFTYFDDALQQSILQALLERLLPGGILVLGAHEQLPEGDWPLEGPLEGEPVYRFAKPGPGPT
jgi:chemotaxis protein methyltransferase CheR